MTMITWSTPLSPWRMTALRPAAWRLSLRGILAALSVAALLLALALRAPLSEPLLGIGLIGLLVLRVMAAPARGIAWTGRVASRTPPEMTSSTNDVLLETARALEEGERGERLRHGGAFDSLVDEVHDASLDSFPASDPPSWSPLRIGAPATR